MWNKKKAFRQARDIGNSRLPAHCSRINSSALHCRASQNGASRRKRLLSCTINRRYVCASRAVILTLQSKIIEQCYQRLCGNIFASTCRASGFAQCLRNPSGVGCTLDIMPEVIPQHPSEPREEVRAVELLCILYILLLWNSIQGVSLQDEPQCDSIESKTQGHHACRVVNGKVSVR